MVSKRPFFFSLLNFLLLFLLGEKSTGRIRPFFFDRVLMKGRTFLWYEGPFLRFEKRLFLIFLSSKKNPKKDWWHFFFFFMQRPSSFILQIKEIFILKKPLLSQNHTFIQLGSFSTFLERERERERAPQGEGGGEGYGKYNWLVNNDKRWCLGFSPPPPISSS